MDITLILLLILTLVGVLVLIFSHFQLTKKLESQKSLNNKFLESIEKYVEIFNEQNISKMIEKNDLANDELVSKKISEVRNEFREKFISRNETLTDEQEVLIDFVTLSLSLLVKIPPSLREKVIEENTDNLEIRKLLKSKLDLIKKHFIPISILEVAIAKDKSE